MRNKKGFTLVELVIVIVIVGILSIVAVPIYRGYTRKAMASEGKALLGAVQTSEKVYYAEFGNFTNVATTDYHAALDVDARSNQYFTAFTVAGTGQSFTASTTGSKGAAGIQLQLMASATGAPTTTESGL